MRFVAPLPHTLPFTHPAALLATWGGVGLLRPAPGTWGSLCALPFGWLAIATGGPGLLMMMIFIAFGAGLWAAHIYADASGEHDASSVVIDEVVGQWIALVLLPLSLWTFLLAFALFRAFDSVKPWPIRWLDKNVSGAFGVMIDDVAAGVAALAVAWAALFYLGR